MSDAWGPPIPRSDIAVMAWQRLLDRPTNVYLKRGTTNLPVQKVRIDLDDTSTERLGPTSNLAKLTGVLFGIMDHPTIPNTNIQRGDTFTYYNVKYEVLGLIYTPGEIQAIIEGNA